MSEQQNPQPAQQAVEQPTGPASSGLHPSATVGTSWTFQDIFEWIIKGVLGLAVFFVGAEYNSIKERLEKTEDKLSVLERVNADKRLDTAEETLKLLEQYKVVDETRDLTDTVSRIETEVRDVNYKLIAIETRLGEVKDTLRDTLTIPGIRVGGTGFIAPGPADVPR